MGNKFDDYLKGKLTATQYEEGLRELFGSPHRRTKVLANPKIATHSELLDLADLLDVSSYVLFSRYEVAKETLSIREVTQLEFIYVAIANDKAKAVKEIDKAVKVAA